ncbi:Ig-like domain-containing protein [Ferrimonas sp.]|uniref:Ig-like domain-containing protein n=1 Tax=Ferrimonas sp. TaxID=2080861 RepID=UPI003A903BAD
MRTINFSVASRDLAVANLSARSSLFAALVTFGLSLPMAVNHANAAPAQSASHSQHSFSSQSMALADLMMQYRQADEAQKAALLDQLVNTVRVRQAELMQLAEHNPAAALKAALPANSRQGMPAEVQAMLEYKGSVDGELEVFYEDYEDGTHKLRHQLKMANGKRITLHLGSQARGLASGTKVRANGLRVGEAMALTSDSDILVLAADGTNTSSGEPALTDALGEQRTAVLLVNFTSNTQEPWTAQQAHDLVFGEVDDFIRENSFGKTWLSGEVLGWFTLAVDPTGCPTMDIAQAARSAAIDSGADLSGYDRLVYAFPNIGCSWSGEATVGGSPSHAWFDGTLDSAGVVSHELGHNLGLMHSHALACAGKPPLSDGCISVEYGDVLDRMGQHTAGHFSAFQKERLGWLNYAGTPPVVTASVSGEYQLEPASLQSSGTKAIRVPRDLDPVTGQQRWYYLETHQAQGFDEFLNSSPYGDSVQQGLVVRLGTDQYAGSGYLLDMTPGSQYYDWNDLALPLGQTYTDSTAGVSITLTSIGSDGATVSISYDQTSCSFAAPHLAVTPGESQWVAPGTPVTYSVSVTNTDAEGCGDSPIDLAANVPQGWSAAFADSSLRLAPGATATTELTVTSSTSATDGYYDLTVNAVHGNDAAYQSSNVVTYIVSDSSGGSNQAPVAVEDSVVLTQVESVVIDVIGNDWDPDGDALQVVGTTQGAKGSVTLQGDNSILYTPANRFKSSDSFSYQLSDGTDTVTGQVSITLQKSGGGNGGGGKGGKGGK